MLDDSGDQSCNYRLGVQETDLLADDADNSRSRPRLQDDERSAHNQEEKRG